jgi:hypothetical protein
MERFDIFHAWLLGQFIPSRQISQLQTDNYERVQSDEGSLAIYVQFIRDAALLLCISENEAQVVERIVEGLSRLNVPALFFRLPIPPSCNWRNWR